MIDSIKIKDIMDEDFQDYKIASMMIAFCTCDWKCAKDGNFPETICQNCSIAKQKTHTVKIEDIYNRYINNHITSAIILGGLEPMLQFEEVVALISYFRNKGCNDTFVIYTGYYEHEISDKIDILSPYRNIILKLGRYKPNKDKYYNNLLGVYLANEEQYAIEL